MKKRKEKRFPLRINNSPYSRQKKTKTKLSSNNFNRNNYSNNYLYVIDRIYYFLFFKNIYVFLKKSNLYF